LLELDIPHFTAPVDMPALTSASGETIPGRFERTGLEVVRDRLRAMDETDLAAQLSMLRQGLRLLTLLDRGRSSDGREGGGSAAQGTADDPCLSAARSIADELQQHALELPDGSLTWGGPASLPLALDTLGRHSLYRGDVGIGLFFAALAAVDGDPRHRELARRAFQGMLVATASAADQSTALGACHGLGGAIYAAATAGALLGEAELTNSAERLVRGLTSETVAAARSLDVEGGVSGALLGLLALYHVRPSRQVLGFAEDCGRRLLDAAQAAVDGGHAWPDEEGLVHRGFAHGAAGIAHALLRLHLVTGESAFLEGALQGYRFSQDVLALAGSGRNRPKRPGGPPEMHHGPPMDSWCHGPTGLALARLGDWKAVQNPSVVDQIVTALEATAARPIGPLDHLCCGNMGRVDALLTASRTLSNAGFEQSARAKAAMVLRRRLVSGSYALDGPDVDSRLSLGLFRGISGIGYVLLRLTRGLGLPCVLSFEPASVRRAERDQVS
jgi:type 2 lantibiotic biosynthesis protein LanM